MRLELSRQLEAIAASTFCLIKGAVSDSQCGFQIGPHVCNTCTDRETDGLAIMERLRAYAIKHRRGFTLDAQIRPAVGGKYRWMRLIAAPVCSGERVARLHGLKLII